MIQLLDTVKEVKTSEVGQQNHHFIGVKDISCLSVSFITGHPCLPANPHASANIKEPLWTRVPLLSEMQRERLREKQGGNKGQSVFFFFFRG